MIDQVNIPQNKIKYIYIYIYIYPSKGVNFDLRRVRKMTR
jgi:hypothetical protein